MDESRIPKGVESIILLEPDQAKVLYRKKARSKSKKIDSFRKSLSKAVVAFVDVQRTGAEAVADKIPMPMSTDGKGLFEQVGKRMQKMGRRGLKVLRA